MVERERHVAGSSGLDLALADDRPVGDTADAEDGDREIAFGVARIVVVDVSEVSRLDGVTTTTTTVLLPVAELEKATGWDLKPEGLCRGEVCVPRRDGYGVLVDDKIDLAAFAALLRRPLAYDADAGIAVLADAPEEHAAAFDARVAPAWTLPDLDGNTVSSSDFVGRKVLLVAWASW